MKRTVDLKPLSTYSSTAIDGQVDSACMDLLARNLRAERGRKIVGAMV